MLESGYELGTLRIRVQSDEFRSVLRSVHSKTLLQTHFTVGGSWNKNLYLKPLQRCYCEDSESPASACAMRRHYYITYTQSLHAVNELIAVGRVGNLLCGEVVSLMMSWKRCEER